MSKLSRRGRASGSAGRSTLPSAIRALERLVGRWNVTIRWSRATHRLVGGPREFVAEVEIAWLDPRGVLRYQLGPSHWFIGGDESSGEFVALYTDDRPVSRVYRMTLNRGLWRVWRDAPGFRQRFEGRLRDHDRRIDAHWDKSEGGKRWARDFDMVFVRQDQPGQAKAQGRAE
jgi:hypothetical protein